MQIVVKSSVLSGIHADGVVSEGVSARARRVLWVLQTVLGTAIDRAVQEV